MRPNTEMNPNRVEEYQKQRESIDKFVDSVSTEDLKPKNITCMNEDESAFKVRIVDRTKKDENTWQENCESNILPKRKEHPKNRNIFGKIVEFLKHKFFGTNLVVWSKKSKISLKRRW